MSWTVMLTTLKRKQLSSWSRLKKLLRSSLQVDFTTSSLRAPLTSLYCQHSHPLFTIALVATTPSFEHCARLRHFITVCENICMHSCHFLPEIIYADRIEVLGFLAHNYLCWSFELQIVWLKSNYGRFLNLWVFVIGRGFAFNAIWHNYSFKYFTRTLLWTISDTF